MVNRRKVLLVDDDVDQLLLFSALLEREKCQVVSAESGEEALDVLGREQFDLILLDIAMPEMSGLELAEKIKSQSTSQRIPVVLMTSGFEPVDFINSSFRADMFCLKNNLKKTLLPGLNDLLGTTPPIGHQG